jgi:hypothetical protein
MKKFKDFFLCSLRRPTFFSLSQRKLAKKAQEISTSLGWVLYFTFEIRKLRRSLCTSAQLVVGLLFQGLAMVGLVKSRFLFKGCVIVVNIFAFFYVFEYT